ncbi:HEAT repeat domain-containing protein [Eudoraea adriatica]|uniref:HEAT repeat domain-containing protein n=1 Tax=Eudoraea adriatica TaxID=446681 RepID=UPI0003722951|nr:HEAT repeat domain-containing protein [Eudoraea adriatica]
MILKKHISYFVALIAVGLMVYSCSQKSKIPKETPLTYTLDSLSAVTIAESSQEYISPKLAEGLTLDLWASDSLAPDPIAIDIDDEGNVYLTRTNRQKNSEFDIRGHQDWMTASISLQTVEDRRAFLRKTFAPELSKENEWFPDLNNDSIHDWKDLTVEKDEIWKLEDTNKDGVADVSKRILEDFHEEITDVAGALLVREDDIFVGIGPDMWRVEDTNGDGVMDTKTSIAHGFAVHIGFGAHGMSGAIEGPDGKIYWGIGDIGASITTVEGETHHLPNQGMIVRCNPDGTNFEVYARGLRNTHEFVFDAYGNLISSDNDGDHRGESERLVHIVEGSDAGWRANWQYGKYTDPKNNSYKVWMDEKLYLPRWEGQAAYIIPPIANYHNGPTGMVYNPGTALGKDWLDKFFLVEFIGDPARSHIWAFNLIPKGASFDLDKEIDVLSGVLPTGLEFGPDGALYLADWINGWGTKNYGRVWKLDVTDSKNDLEAQRQETQRLMIVAYEDLSADELTELLAYPDMRIRQKAQFELANRTFWGYKALKKVILEDKNQFARIHAIWGIGQIASDNNGKAEPLMELLDDEDPEIIAQAAKVLGDVKYKEAGEKLITLLEHENERVRFFAAQALGRIEHKNAVQPLINFLATNNDEDVYLRHAGVLALSRIGEIEPIVALSESPERSLRIASVLVLRRLQNAEVALFLKDNDEYIVTEAARAINDDWSIPEAMPALAGLLKEERFTSEPLLRRSINAALRVGGEEELDMLIEFAKRTTVSGDLRGEALAAIGTWASPSVLDRVDGRYRGEINRDSNFVKEKIQGDIPIFLEDKDPNILIGASKILGTLGISSYNPQLKSILNRDRSPEVRVAMIEALGELGDDNITSVVKTGMQDMDENVRAAAVGLIPELNIPKNELPAVIGPIFKNGSLREQQRMIDALTEMPLDQSRDAFTNLIQKAGRKQLNPGVILDLIEAVESTESEDLIAGLSKLKSSGYSVDSYKEALYGGSRRSGANVFKNNSAAQCVRCHALAGAGGKVGPPMDNIANVLSREEILESLIEPGARLAPGYGSVVLTLKDGQVVAGILAAENKEEIILRTSDAEPMEIAVSRIKKRENMPSAMPPMGTVLTKRELRDLVEFLSSLKE